ADSPNEGPIAPSRFLTWTENADLRWSRPPRRRRRHSRNVHSEDQCTVEREATLPASLLRPGTLPIGCGPMTALLAPSQNVPQGCHSVIKKELRSGSADTCPVAANEPEPRSSPHRQAWLSPATSASAAPTVPARFARPASIASASTLASSNMCSPARSAPAYQPNGCSAAPGPGAAPGAGVPSARATYR